MNNLGEVSWYTLQPKQDDKKYFGTKADWTQTLATKINQCGATLFQERAKFENVPVITRKVVVPKSFEKQFNLLGYYNPKTKSLSGRFDVEFNDQDNITVVENDNYCTIKLIHDHHR